MSDTVIIALIVAAIILAVLVIFRRQISRFFFKAGVDGIEAELQTHEPGNTTPPPASAAGERPSVVISGNKQFGAKQSIEVGRADVEVKDNVQLGADQDIIVQPDKPAAKLKP